MANIIKMSNILNHINNTLLIDESQKDIYAFILKIIGKQKKSIYSKVLPEINIDHKLNRIQKEIRFAQNNLMKYQKLTLREKEIIILLAKGNNNPKIAQQLFISRYTVEQHRKNINAKLNVKSFPQLMLFVYAFDLI